MALTESEFLAYVERAAAARDRAAARRTSKVIKTERDAARLKTLQERAFARWFHPSPPSAGDTVAAQRRRFAELVAVAYGLDEKAATS